MNPGGLPVAERDSPETRPGHREATEATFFDEPFPLPTWPSEADELARFFRPLDSRPE
jgi:hypothetical protein